MNPSVKIFAGTGSTALAEKIAQRFGAPIGKINIQKFLAFKFYDIRSKIKIADSNAVLNLIYSYGAILILLKLF